MIAVLGVTLLAVTLARPQAGSRSTLAAKVGVDVVIALDFSKSMLARDAYPNRIDRAKSRDWSIDRPARWRSRWSRRLRRRNSQLSAYGRLRGGKAFLARDDAQ